MTNYLSQPPTTGHTPAHRTDLANDTQTSPPFRRLDELHGALDELDAWVSTFIGRLTPYCHDKPTPPVTRTGQPAAEGEAFSPFEQRIIHAREKTLAILDALDEMNQHLNL